MSTRQKGFRLLVLLGLFYGAIGSRAADISINNDGSSLANPTVIEPGTYDRFYIGNGLNNAGYGIVTAGVVYCTMNDGGGASRSYVGNRAGPGYLILTNDASFISTNYNEIFGDYAEGYGHLIVAGSAQCSFRNPRFSWSGTAVVVVANNAVFSSFYGGTWGDNVHAPAPPDIGGDATLYLMDNARFYLSNDVVFASDDSRCNIYQTGGIFSNTDCTVSIGYASGSHGEYQISSGAVYSSASAAEYWRIGNHADGTGVMHVVGSVPTAISLVQTFYLYSNGTFRCSVDTGGVTEIQSSADSAYLWGTLDMDISREAELYFAVMPLSDPRRTLRILSVTNTVYYKSSQGYALKLDPADTNLWELGDAESGATLTVKFMRRVNRGTIFTGW